MAKIKIPLKKQKAKIIDCKTLASVMKAHVKTQMVDDRVYALNIFAPNTPDNEAFIKGIKKDAAELGIDVCERSTSDWEPYIHDDPYIVMYGKSCGHEYDDMYDVDAYNPHSCWDSCTGEAVAYILANLDIDWAMNDYGAGKQIAVVGRGDTGCSIVDALRHSTNATIILCNSRSNLKRDLKNADIIVSCVGQANAITKQMVKKGAVVIDVGIDVSEDVKDVASYITPVPNGIGLVTRAMLMNHVVDAINVVSE